MEGSFVPKFDLGEMKKAERDLHERMLVEPDSEGGNTIQEKLQPERDAAAQKIREFRRARDERRVESEKLLAQVRERLGLKNGASSLSYEADRLQNDARHELSTQKSRLEAEENRQVKEKYTNEVMAPLQRLVRGESGPEDVAEENIDWEKVAMLLKTRERPAVLALIKEGAAKITPQMKPLDAFAAKILKEDIHGDGSTWVKNGDVFRILDNLRIWNALDDPDFKAFFESNYSDKEQLRNLFMASGHGVADMLATKYIEVMGERGRQEFKDMLDASFSDGSFRFGIQRLLRASGEAGKIAKEEIGKYFTEQFGIGYEAFSKRWNSSTERGKDSLYLNIPAMLSLEEKLPGSVKRLREEYGIAEFGRYPEEALIAQLQEENFNRPYGVILFPQADHNRAFHQDTESLQKVFDQTKDKLGMKIVESGKPIELARHLLTFDKKYGAEHKISYAIIGGHGTPESIYLGSEPSGQNADRVRIKQSDFDGAGVQRLKGIFEEHPSFVLMACSTGAEQGIAQKISEVYDADVVAPKENSAVRDLSAHFDADGHVQLDAEYSVPKNRYSSGKLVEQSEEKVAA